MGGCDTGYSSNKLEATICMAAADPAGGDAVFSGCTVEFLYTTDPDRVIDAAFGELSQSGVLCPW